MKKSITLFIAFSFFVSLSVEGYPEDSQVAVDALQVQAGSEILVPSNSETVPVQTEEKPTYGVQSIGIMSNVPQPPNLEESQSNSHFQPTTAFMQGPGDQVDTSSGALAMTQTDITLPGKNGMDLVISRTYNSKGFRTNPHWSKYKGVDPRSIFYGRFIADPRCFIPVFPESFGGWAGKGWQFNIFGRLVFNRTEKEQRWVPSDYLQGAIIQLGSENISFDRNLNPRDKGGHYILRPAGAGFVLIAKNGIKYYFETQVLYRSYDYAEIDDWSGDKEESEIISSIYYLSSIEDPVGNMIKIQYEEVAPSFHTDYRYRYRRGTSNINPFEGIIFVWDWNITYRIFRPSKIVDTYNREISIHYRSNDMSSIASSQIDSLSFLDSSGQKQECTYIYGEDATNKDCLIEMVPPAGNSTTYKYTPKNEYLSDEYEDEGDIITEIKYPAGARVSYAHEWHDPVSEKPGMSENDRQRFSSYRVISRSVSGSRWSYSYSGGEEFNNYRDGNVEGRIWAPIKASVTDPAGQTTNHDYKKGLTLKEINSAGHVSDFVWDYSNMNLMSIKVNKGGSTTFTEYLNYDDYGNPRTIKEYGLLSDPYDDKEINIEYLHDINGTYRNKHIVDRVAHQWIKGRGGTMGEVYNEYDGDGKSLLVRKRVNTDSGMATTSLSYDDSGNMLTSTDPNGNTTRFTYMNGSPLPATMSINAGGRTPTLSKTYSPYTGALLSETDYNGNTSAYQYDTVGRLTRKTNPDGTNISYAYNDSSNTIDIRDEKNEETTYVYDNLGRLVETRQPESVTTRYTYDPLSRITRVTDAGGRNTNYSYDGIGRLTSLTYADGSSATLGYSDAQNSVDVTDGNGNTTKYKYDGLENMTEVTEANGVKSVYAYTCLGGITAARDPRKLTTLYAYSPDGKLTLIKESDGSTTNLSYDKTGNLKRREDGKGAVTNYVYDELNRATEKRSSDSKYNVKYNYDEASSGNGLGMLTSVDDMNGKTTYSYNNMGRMAGRSKTIDNLSYLTAYEYDPAGNMIKVSDPSGKGTSYIVDGLGRVIMVKRDTKDGIKTIAEYTYNPTGTIARVNFRNGIGTTYTYDNRDRIKQIKTIDQKGNVIVQQNYAYDAVGNRISLTSLNEEDVRYEYDNLNRLTKVNWPKDSEEFKYDVAGNRTSLSHAFGNMEYVYDPASNKLTEVRVNERGRIKYSYDGAGNQEKEQYYTGDDLVKTVVYKYDPDDRLTAIERKSASDKPQDVSGKSEYVYDDGGIRVKKVTTDKSQGENGIASIYYICDQSNNVINEADGAGKIRSSYIYANGQRIAAVRSDDSAEYFHNDALGSPVAITNAAGEVLNRYVYEPFGNIVASKSTSAQGTSDNAYTFSGKERDAESELFYFGARYYNPILGRFISRDIAEPDLEDPQTMNRYVYALNNPVKYVDLDGYEALEALYYALVRLGGRKYGLDSAKGELVCNQYVYQAYKVGEGVSGFKESRWESGGQIDWFKSKSSNQKFIYAKDGAAERAELGDVVYFGDRGNFTGHEALVAAKTVKDGIAYVKLAESAKGMMSGIRSGWVNLNDPDSIKSYYGRNINSNSYDIVFRGIGQLDPTYSYERRSWLMNEISYQLNRPSINNNWSLYDVYY